MSYILRKPWFFGLYVKFGGVDVGTRHEFIQNPPQNSHTRNHIDPHMLFWDHCHRWFVAMCFLLLFLFFLFHPKRCCGSFVPCCWSFIPWGTSLGSSPHSPLSASRRSLSSSRQLLVLEVFHRCKKRGWWTACEKKNGCGENLEIHGDVKIWEPMENPLLLWVRYYNW